MVRELEVTIDAPTEAYLRERLALGDISAAEIIRRSIGVYKYLDGYIEDDEKRIFVTEPHPDPESGMMGDPESRRLVIFSDNRSVLGDIPNPY